MSVDARHASSLAMLAAASARYDATTGMERQPPQLRVIQYMHTSNLPQGRALWLRAQIDDDSIDWAVTVDGDTTFSAIDVLDAFWSVVDDVAIGIAPVRIGGSDGVVNLNLDIPDGGERRIEPREITETIKEQRLIASGGFGLAIFNLRWFRRRWPDPAPEGISMMCGEDIAMCRSVRARGGAIRALRVRTDHFAFGEDQLR